MKFKPERLVYSFSIQLVIMHLKKNLLMMLSWILLFGFITQSFSQRFGIPYLFLDPEYLGKVDFISFLITGMACGVFIMSFNISSYILNSFRFPFLASVSKSFQKYSINNFIIPATFLLIYVFEIFKFQHFQQLKNIGEISINIASFLTGVTVVVLIILRYFLATNKDIYKLFGVRHSDHIQDEKYEKALHSDTHPSQKRRKEKSEKHWKVLTYLSNPFTTRLVRDTSHYNSYMLKSVFRQNHMNAAVMEIITIAIFIVMGLFRDISVAQIPAAASLFLLFTMFMMISGVIRFWAKAWASTFIISIFLIFNFISGFKSFNPESKAYGLDYNGNKISYDVNHIASFTSDTIILKDLNETVGILEKWKSNWNARGIDKPKLAVISVSGGGLRASLFTFKSMLTIDSMLQGNLMQHTRLITGSSGGMIAAAYYRGLYLDSPQQLKAEENQKTINLICGDLLNPTAFSLIVSDLFMNIQSEHVNNNKYPKDRGYSFEKKLNENLGNILNRPLSYYRNPEMNAQIPMMIISPTIINDGRSMYISPVGISYMIMPPDSMHSGNNPLPDGIEYSKFFSNKHPENTRFSDILRMNASFPYIMPATSLPTTPEIQVMDAGIRDNYGIQNATRFIYTFRNWIQENTSGVVLIQIRDNHKRNDLENKKNGTILSKILSPMQNLSGNFLLMQDYTQDDQIRYLTSYLGNKIDYVKLELPLMDEKIALSWHLTEREKKFLTGAVYSPENKESMQRLKMLLQPKN